MTITVREAVYRTNDGIESRFRVMPDGVTPHWSLSPYRRETLRLCRCLYADGLIGYRSTRIYQVEFNLDVEDNNDNQL